MAASFDGLAKDFFGEAVGIDVGGVEEIDAGFHADIDQAGGFGHVARSPRAEEFSASAEGASAKTECGYFQAGAAQLSEFHRRIDACIF